MFKRNYNFLNFKGKSAETNEWVFGTPVKADNGDIVMIDSSLSQTVIRRKTLCQKTNSVDAKETPIFEGDIVATIPGRFNKDQKVGVVRFGEEPGYLDSTVNVWKIHWAEYTRDTANVEVIGNVYDECFRDDDFLKENWPDDWERIKSFVEHEAEEIEQEVIA